MKSTTGVNAERLAEAVRKHAKTVLLPSVAQAIVEELGAQETQPLFILHTGAFFGSEQDEWEVEAISQERVADYCRERSSQHDPLYAAPPDAAKRIAELEAELAEARKDAERIKEAVDDAAYEWASYVDVDHAPVTLRVYMEGAVRAALAKEQP